jgi:NAD(P)-dependent dehydrogenase (short-subunit alcohol dehydrogenase family)
MTAGSLDRAVVITGASTGIGRAAVAKAVREGAHVFPSVRKQADADSLKAEFGEAVAPVIFDVADESAVRTGAAHVAQALGGRRLFGLVNNAGIAVPGPLLHLDTDELRRQFEINFFGVHNVTRAFADMLGADAQRAGKPGRIIMISSVGGQNGAPFVGPYAASKFAMEGYSQSLRRELMLYGIDVIVIGPGAIATPIWDKAEQNDLTRYSNTDYGPAVVEGGPDAPWRRSDQPDAITEEDRLGDRMRDDEDGRFDLVPEMGDEPLHLVASRLVEGREWLVHQQDPRLDDEAAGDRDPLLLSAG